MGAPWAFLRLLMPSYSLQLPQRSWGPGCSWSAGEMCLVVYMENRRQMIAAYLCLVSHISNGANGPLNPNFWKPCGLLR
ncbi:uncharacterized protein BT62DRAFT_1081794 [Guyanagaster necrorhizus]|uniref:Secreted protein n=1 Tax=Guyanagaster necrorhizus TaxID=856835 RepID=A0A9P8ALR6_9AGAR|nr:uncharacterized protein BT62DRAFT_1081794 [Guyanagaster necrorhizus MCA 3950]KAG7439102.1 hypothetical protein BT62DRAFT_1081794 [Guyanagaster necrorhizus MCA 3950]